MSLYLMADADLQEYKALEEKALSVDASDLNDAVAKSQRLEPKISGDTASISVTGMLTPKRIAALDFFGRPQTVWGDIVGAVAQAEKSGAKNFKIYGDSGGGIVDGMFEAMDALASTPMNTEVIVTGQAQSAMYMLASQADKISSTKEYNWIGSVGVKAPVGDANYVSNTDSPKKIGAVDSEGKSAVTESLDDLYAMIVPRMAAGRNTTDEKIRTEYGQGASMTAKTALSRGMIDAIKEPKPAGRSGVNKGHTNMDMATLKAEHPDLYSQIFEQGKKAGSEEFKALAEDHLKMAEASGAMDRALEDIKAGNPVTGSAMAHHAAEGIKKAQINARTEEAPAEVGEGKDAQAEAHSLKDDTQEVIDAYAEEGLEVEL